MSNYGKEQIYISDDERIIKRASAQALLRVARAGKPLLDFIESYKENGLPIVFPYANEILEMQAALKEVEHLL